MTELIKLLKKHKYAVMSAVLVILVIFLIITVITLYSDKSENTPVASEQTSSAEPVSFNRKKTLSGDSTFLVICTGENDREIMFISLVEFKVYSENIIITPLSENTTFNGKTYSEIYSYGGIDPLLTAVENIRNSAIDRYAILSRSGFVSLIDKMGNITEYVEEDYTYMSSDKSYEVNMGENELEGAMLYTYIKINAAKPDGMDRTAEVLCNIVNTYLKTVSEADSLDLFGEVCNCINTNVTIADYYSAQNDIEYLLSHNTVCTSDYGTTK